VFDLKEIVDRVTEAMRPVKEREENEDEQIQSRDGMDDQTAK
jgi:hypothetical protein